MKQTTNEERVTKALAEDMPVFFDYLESQLNDDEFIIGHTMTVADFGLGSNLLNMSHGGVDVDADRWPKVAAYKARLFATELFSQRIAADKAMMTT